MRLAMREMTSSAFLSRPSSLRKAPPSSASATDSGVFAELREQIGCFPPVEPVHHQLGSPVPTISSTFGTAAKRRLRFWSRVASSWSMS